MARFSRVILTAVIVVLIKAEDDLKDFEFSDPDEVMIAQESRQYQTVVKPPIKIIKPSGITNSHRPQYNLDSLEDRSHDVLDDHNYSSPRRSLIKNYKSSSKIRAKESMTKDAVLRALERKDHVGKFAQILPIIRAMSGNQRVALASLVANQVSTPPGRAPLNLAQRDTTTPSTTESESTTPMSVTKISSKYSNVSRQDNGTLDLMAEATNQTLAQDLPVAEKLRALNRYSDRKGSQFRRGTYQSKPPVRRTTPEPASPISQSIAKRRPTPARKLPVSAADPNKCELFTNTLCLHSEDYPTEAIVSSIRRNKAAAAALLADYKDPGEGVVDGVTAAQEAKYNEQHYFESNRRGDTANRDFAGAGEAGFMCPSTVKYARPQRARATSGQWKYIVNTGEHTQTLRLEKCLKPKESCTYLTDNFKSKCVQVYNYHRLLTWDQQNGLHMDIFKVPTCCSCHIEGYSVAFPPLGHRLHETSSEHFPGEDLSSETGNHAFEAVQATVHKPKRKLPPVSHKKPLESFTPFADNQNLISGIPFSKQIDNNESPDTDPVDSYGNSYFPDSFNQATSVRHVKRPLSARNPPIPQPQSNYDDVTLPSYLEPPTPAAASTFNFIKDTTPKYKLPGSQFKRTTRPNLPGRRPIRKKISDAPDDLVSSGSQAIEAFPSSSAGDTMEDESDYEEPDIGQATSVNTPKPRITIAPKLPALTTEPAVPGQKAKEVHHNINEQFNSNGQRVNYNYHPIIDFFDEDKEMVEDGSIDREDVEQSFEPNVESEWKPISNPPTRNTQPNIVGRKKLK
ncbi:unnamed protein product [Chrysodeixis includens]|uniref:Spaetzle domain-containing protein n=1 Tax=Chrysodeixis includens TaxID=689277 RepID=A0A9P0C4J0_CHRIL|nr:unnamed protein product [Chrysodeixis includens]